MAEFFGYETRNKYEILTEQSQVVGFAAEQQKGWWNFLVRQFLGHWRSFEVRIFDELRQPIFICQHPFRFYFNRFEISDHLGQPLGALQKRFGILTRVFDVEGSRGEILLRMSSPIYRFWTFYFFRRDQEVSRIEKKWSGLMSEAFTDRDNFKLTFSDRNLPTSQKALLLAAALFVDLIYFERKAGK